MTVVVFVQTVLWKHCLRKHENTRASKKQEAEIELSHIMSSQHTYIVASLRRLLKHVFNFAVSLYRLTKTTIYNLDSIITKGQFASAVVTFRTSLRSLADSESTTEVSPFARQFWGHRQGLYFENSISMKNGEHDVCIRFASRHSP